MTVGNAIAEFLVQRGVDRVYGLCGGHIQPIWDALSRASVRIVDVRHEAAAVYMAHAQGVLTDSPGVALVTAGPGLANAVTAMANAWSSQVPVLVIAGHPPRPQYGSGAMQEIPQLQIAAPICRFAAHVGDVDQVAPAMVSAWAAAVGCDGPAGPSYLELPRDLLDETHPVDPSEMAPPALSPSSDCPSREMLERASEMIASSRRPLVVAGHSIHACRDDFIDFLDLVDGVYVDSADSRGAVNEEHASYVPALRARAMAEADLVITVGRRLDFQLGYGSSAVFSNDPTFLRIGRHREDISPIPRRGLELKGEPCAVLRQLHDLGGSPIDRDTGWLAAARRANAEKVGRLRAKMASSMPDRQGRMHPYRLIAAINEILYDDSIVIVDGGDILSFARVGLRPVRFLDCGPLGSLGVGVPFATAAALSAHDASRVVALIGDGAFGFSAMEIDTAVRHGAKAIYIVANNEAWNIERHDQIDRYGGNTVGVDLPNCRYDLLARSLGAYAERVESPEELHAAIDRALRNAPAVLDVAVSRDARSPDFESGLAEVPPQQPLRTWDQAESRLRTNPPRN